MSREIQVSDEFIQQEKINSNRLNQQYSIPGYHRYPQPSPERYITKDHLDVNIGQIRTDFGPVVSLTMQSILETHHDIQNIQKMYSILNAEEQLLANGLLNAKNAYLQDLSNTISDIIDAGEILQTYEEKSNEIFDNIGSNHE